MSAMLTERIKRLRGKGQNLGRRVFFGPVAKVVCKDGFEMSVQASETHYCTPRDSHGPWFEFEVGYPSQRVESLMPFIDGGDSEPTGAVYAWVPGSIIEEVIAAHGGIDEESR